MRIIILILLFLLPLPAFAQDADTAQAIAQVKGVLIKDISMDGFVLEDCKEQFLNIFKPYRHKYMSIADMDDILHHLQDIYEREGYQQLVAISYQVIKHRLVYTVSMTA